MNLTRYAESLNRPGYIYIARIAENLIKVGATQNIVTRTQGLRSEFGVCLIISLIASDDCFFVERRVHRALQSYRAAEKGLGKEVYRDDALKDELILEIQNKRSINRDELLMDAGNESLVTVSEAARQWGTSRQGVHRAAWHGTIRAVLRDRRLFIPASEIPLGFYVTCGRNKKDKSDLRDANHIIFGKPFQYTKTGLTGAIRKAVEEIGKSSFTGPEIVLAVERNGTIITPSIRRKILSRLVTMAKRNQIQCADRRGGHGRLVKNTYCI